MKKWSNLSHDELLDCLTSGASAAVSQPTLCEIARRCVFPDVRKAAVKKIESQSALAEIAAFDEEFEVYKTAIDRLIDEKLLEKVAFSAWDKYACVLAVRKIKNPDALFEIADRHAHTEVRIDAVNLLDCPRRLYKIAANNSDPEVRASAVKKLTSDAEIARIALKDEEPAVYRAALKALSCPVRLTEIALASVGTVKGIVALYRLRELAHKMDIDAGLLGRLYPFFKQPNAVAILISIMEKAGCSWVSFCDVDTVEVLRRELRTSDPLNAQLLEKSVLKLYAHRPDLRGYMRSKEWLAPLNGEDLPAEAQYKKRLLFFA